MAVYDITEKVLQKNNLLLGYKFDAKSDFFLRAEVKGFRKTPSTFNKLSDIFDVLTADYIRIIDDKNRYGIEV